MPWHCHAHSYLQVPHELCIIMQKWELKRVEKLAVTYAKYTEREMGWKKRECCDVLKLNAWVVHFNMHQHAQPLQFNRNKKPRRWDAVYSNVILPKQLGAGRKWARKLLKMQSSFQLSCLRGWFFIKTGFSFCYMKKLSLKLFTIPSSGSAILT